MILLLNLLVAGFMVAITFSVHFIGLMGLTLMLHRAGRRAGPDASVFREGRSILAAVFGLFALHSVQIWLYAFAYLTLGEFGTVETALYFSIACFTTVGFGDVIPSENWRLLGAAEGANGFLLIGWSTAFLVSLTGRLRAFEARIEKLEK
jgi:hypothetical protein